MNEIMYVDIGDFRLFTNTDRRLWIINKETYESGIFDKEKLAEIIKKFFIEEF